MKLTLVGYKSRFVAGANQPLLRGDSIQVDDELGKKLLAQNTAQLMVWEPEKETKTKKTGDKK